MPVERVIAINGSGGAGTDISATIHCRRVEVIEDGATAAQGLTYKDLMDNFTATKTAGTGDGVTPQIVLGNTVAHQNNAGPILGNPAYSTGGSSVPATKLLGTVKSKTATATTIRVREIE